MKRQLFVWMCFWIVLVSVLNCWNTRAWAVDVGWAQRGVRVWYFGGVGSGGGASSNAEEAYLVNIVNGNDIHVTHHSALSHWSLPNPIETKPYQLNEQGPFWIHPQVLQNLKAGDFWMGHELTMVTHTVYTYDTFPYTYNFLPIKELFDLQPQRELVKATYMIPGFSVGTAYFDAETGLLLYYHTLWGASQMFFILSEINYDFVTKNVFAEDDGPHTGFKSFVSEQSLGTLSGHDGGSVIIQSIVESRYGNTVEMRVISSVAGPIGSWQKDENYCYFGDVPILRYMDATQAINFPPEQWDPFGEYLWWWGPPGMLSEQSVTILDVSMDRTATTPYTFTAAESPARFFFSELWFGNDGYMTQFSAEDSQLWMDVTPGDINFQNGTTVIGLDYYRDIMAKEIPIHTITAIAGPGGSITPSGSVDVLEGSSQTFTIIPDAGFIVDTVAVDGKIVGSVYSYTFTDVTRDHQLSADFLATPNIFNLFLPAIINRKNSE